MIIFPPYTYLQCDLLSDMQQNREQRQQLAKITGEFLGIQSRTHQNDLEVRPPGKQVTNDNHQEVRQRVTFMYFIENNM